MDFKEKLTNYLKVLRRMVYPAFCPVCSKDLELEEEHICNSCLLKIKELKAPLCAKCSGEIPPYSEKTTICQDCRGRKYYFKNTWSLVDYDETISRLFREIKFKKKRWLLKIFKERIKRFIDERRDLSFDYIMPVPMDRKRKFQREFDQTDILAKVFSKYTGIKAKNRLLKKIKATEPQSLLPRRKRLANLEKAFSVPNPKAIKDKEILLVDDVFTTGTTVNECARELVENGARSVSVFTLAR